MAETVLVRGNQMTSEATILPGWNLIGVPINGIVDLPAAVLQPLWECVNGLFREVSGSDIMVQGQGYWLYLNGVESRVLDW